MYTLRSFRFCGTDFHRSIALNEIICNAHMKTKTELFCPVFKTICVHTYRFRIVFAVHTTTPYPFENAFIPLMQCSNERDACAFQYIGPRNWRKIEATWQHLSAILNSHGRMVWRPVVSVLMASPFSDSIVFSVNTRKQRFQKASFSNRFILESVFEWLRFR